MASGIYNRFKANLMNGVVDLEADTIKVALLDATETSPTVTDNVLTDVIATPGSAPEISGTGYTNGGETITTGTVTQGATTDWDGDDTSWTSSTFTTYAALIYDNTATDNLIALIDFGGAQTVTAGTFTIQWHANGIITLA
jgi:hypothetical protein